jgi:hypothetical protein
MEQFMRELDEVTKSLNGHSGTTTTQKVPDSVSTIAQDLTDAWLQTQTSLLYDRDGTTHIVNKRDFVDGLKNGRSPTCICHGKVIVITEVLHILNRIGLTNSKVSK